MMTNLRRCGVFFALLFLAVTASCKQGEGERCQLDEDCSEGLYCELAGNTRAQGGFCKAPGSSTAVVDMSRTADLTSTDM
jgi:hypothetical protein